MAPMKQNSNNYSSSKPGEGIVRQASILASCYLVDSGIPEVPSTGLPSPPSSPPLAALTPTNELTLTPKARKSSSRSSIHGRTGSGNNTTRQHRRGGAALRIREECERFFCEILRATFLGEGNSASQHSRLTSAYNNYNNNNNNNTGNGRPILDGTPTGGVGMTAAGPLTPPYDYPIANENWMAGGGGHGVNAWLEIWDYAGGSSFRAFLAENASGEEKSMFVFFDAHVLGRDLKKALVALIELAEGPFACTHMVICIDRSIPGDEAQALTKGLQWAGFSLTALDFISGGCDVISRQWLFMGMEV
ncbi:ornithine decarboxylase antizyme-domain-containing protein [Lasiosphaeria miniovina]|uniref:Ornithine decarboxylase antizyme n=1 Tax=Lasiosphaeria miniovina TaxID=1954250 RepID=A0AA40AK69_9PEZI|nr:ornithine decarboxylase antizyme-domain-containing protein [Lasiosphaeria miniovina]KAK0717383.1 ornithine decarboxylase antizyme-domain-containing protein [Lasiosphaeria miniovina]